MKISHIYSTFTCSRNFGFQLKSKVSRLQEVYLRADNLHIMIQMLLQDHARGVPRISSRGGGTSVKIIIRSKIYNLGKIDR